jgi:signal peptidase II
MLRIAATVVVLDLFTKFIAVRFLENSEPVEVVPALLGEGIGPLVQFRFFRNPGAAFSLGTNATLLFTILAIIISVFIWRVSKKVDNKFWAISLGFILGGALGNLIDRIFRDPGVLRGAVVDFVQIPYWAIFNIADMAISVTAVILAIATIFGKEPYKKSVK